VTPIAILKQLSGYPVNSPKHWSGPQSGRVNFLRRLFRFGAEGFAPEDRQLKESIPEALSVTDRVCSSVNIGTTRPASI
jgi:uncharacterized protein (UPF0210 family)